MKKFLCLAAALVLLFAMAACGNSEPQPTPTPAPEPTPEPITELAIVVDEAGLAALDSEYPELKKLDLSGSSCYAAIEEYIASHPSVAVSYTVSLGGSEHEPAATALTLNPGDYDAAALMTNLAYLPDLESLLLPETTLSVEQLAEHRLHR